MTNETTDQLYEHQVELEMLFNKNQLKTRILKEFSEEPFFAERMKQFSIPEKFGYDLLIAMALHKRCDMATLVGVLRHHFDTAQEVATMLLKSAEADLVTWKDTFKCFVTLYTVSNDVQLEIDKFQFPMPMVVEPRELEKNTDDGYLTTRGSIILKDNHHNDDVCLDHLNMLNKIKFRLNKDVVKHGLNTWSNLDKPKQGETREEFDKRKKAFEKFRDVSADVQDLLIQEGNEFYFTHKVDKRGRTYCQGYHISYQGHCYNKAVLEFSEGEHI